MPETTKITTSNIDHILASQGVPDDVREVYSSLKQYKDHPARGKWTKRREEAWDAIENEMWDDSDKKDLKAHGQKALVINKLVKGVQGSSAIVTDQKPEIKFLPIGSGDLYVAELLKRAHDVVWEKNEGQDETYSFVEEAKIGALAFMDHRYDQSKGPFGRIVFENIDPTDVYFDGDSKKRDFSDTHLVKAIKRTKRYIKEHYDDIEDDDMEFEISLDAPTKSEGVEGKDNYAVENDTPADLGGKEKEDNLIWEIEAWMLITKKEHCAVIIKPDGNTDIQVFESKKKATQAIKAINSNPDASGAEYLFKAREVREQRIIVGKKLISKKENPNGEDGDGDPVINLIGLKHQRTRTAYPMSPTNYALPLNKEKNKRRAQFIYGTSQNVNAPIIEPEGSVWEGSPGTPGSRIKVPKTVAFLPQRMANGAQAMELFLEAETKADTDIDDQYDLQDVMKGKLSGDVAWQTVYALQEFGGMMSKPFLRALESSLVRGGKTRIAMVLKYWTREMWERLIETDEMQTWIPDQEKAKLQQGQKPDPEAVQNKWTQALDLIRPKDPSKEPGVSLIDIDVKVMAGSSMPTNRMAKLQTAIEMTKAGIYDAEAALEYVDDPNKDKIVARMQQAAMMNMQNQLTTGG